MKRKYTLLLVLSGILFLSNIWFLKSSIGKSTKIDELQSSISDMEKTIKNQKKSITDLEEQVESFADIAEEKQGQLDNVETFDNSVSANYSSHAVSYTGSAIETNIDGEFEGWEGETIFKMRNGSIWQQASYAYTYHYAYAPEVLIYSKNGTTYMRVEGVDSEIQVKRIK